MLCKVFHFMCLLLTEILEAAEGYRLEVIILLQEITTPTEVNYISQQQLVYICN